MIVGDSIDKTEFGNSKTVNLEVSKSTNFIPKLKLKET
jgi:hypothetical protein